jgi:hypothetical protein
MHAATPMDVDETARYSDLPVALAQAHLQDARATAQNDSLRPLWERRAHRAGRSSGWPYCAR